MRKREKGHDFKWDRERKVMILNEKKRERKWFQMRQREKGNDFKWEREEQAVCLTWILNASIILNENRAGDKILAALNL